MKSDFDPRKSYDDGDTLPEQANVYVPPRPLAQLSEHRTIDVKAIRIAAELDPRQAKTQLRMSTPPVRHRRGLPLFVVGSAVVLALFGVALYVELTRTSELPPVVTAAGPSLPATAQDIVTSSPVLASTAGVTNTTPGMGTSVPPTGAVTETATATVVPNGPRAAAPRSKTSVRAPRKAKVTREPWLE
jgi:hypothetical protein